MIKFSSPPNFDPNDPTKLARERRALMSEYPYDGPAWTASWASIVEGDDLLEPELCAPSEEYKRALALALSMTSGTDDDRIMRESLVQAHATADYLKYALALALSFLDERAPDVAPIPGYSWTDERQLRQRRRSEQEGTVPGLWVVRWERDEGKEVRLAIESRAQAYALSQIVNGRVEWVSKAEGDPVPPPGMGAWRVYCSDKEFSAAELRDVPMGTLAVKGCAVVLECWAASAVDAFAEMKKSYAAMKDDLPKHITDSLGATLS